MQLLLEISKQIDGPIAAVRSQFMTLTAVGQDFVQLREADGTERFVPLARVDVVVRPDK